MEEASGINRSVYDQLLTRMRHNRTPNRCMFVCSNPSLGWIKDVLVDNEDRIKPENPEHHEYDPSATTYIWETALNKYLPPDFIKKISFSKPDWWIAKFVKGSFTHNAGQVYPNVANCFIDPIDIPLHWERTVALDHGYRNPTGVLFGAIDAKEGILYIYDEYYVRERTVPEHAKALRPKIDAIAAGTMRFMIADPSTRNRTDPVNGKSVQGLYQEYGLYFQPANNDMDAGIMRVNSYIERGKVKIFKTCTNLIKETLNYKFPEVTMDNDKNADERPIKRDDHLCDTLRYTCLHLPENPDHLVQAYVDTGGWKKKNDPFDDDFDDEEYNVSGKGFLGYGY